MMRGLQIWIGALAFLLMNGVLFAERMAQGERKGPPPNVVIILADDLGSGDVSAYQSKGAAERGLKVRTPNLDRLARAGIRFTDAHSPSAVCSPTRYGLLTGRYAWRTRMKNWVLNGYSRLLIEPGRATLASMLKARGYRTACIGKWHLGLGSYDASDPNARVDFAPGVFDAGPHTVGFDEVYVIPASLDMPPYVYVTETGLESPASAETPGSKRVWDGGGGFWRKGPMAEDFDFTGVLPRITAQAVKFVEDQHGKEEPFFLYFPLTAPHTPWVPTADFAGKSEAGAYGDFATQVDDAVGKILNAVDSIGAAENTIVIFTSDNGAHWRPADVDKYEHAANLNYRGMKADIYEAGHRIPFIVRWPSRIGKQEVTTALVGLNDLYATIAELVGHELGADEAPDSLSFANALQDSDAAGRTELVLHSGDGMFAIRHGNWKLIEGLGSGGFTAPARRKAQEGEHTWRLYDLANDLGETNDLSLERTEIVAKCREALEAVRRNTEDGQ